MSFQDLERGLGSPSTRSSNPEDLGFQAIARTVSLQTHKMNANVAAMSSLVDLLGSSRDTADLRNKLHNLTDVTREVVKASTEDVKTLAGWVIRPEDRRHAQEKQRGAADFSRALKAFQTVSKRSAERQRLFVERARATLLVDAASGGSSGRDDEQDGTGQLLELSEQRQSLVEAVPDSEVEFQEQLIQEREGEIEEIEQGITELNQIFRDLAQIVGDQGDSINDISSNIFSVVRDTERAGTELTQASEYQRKAGRRMLCLLLVFFVVLAIVVLAVLS